MAFLFNNLWLFKILFYYSYVNDFYIAQINFHCDWCNNVLISLESLIYSKYTFLTTALYINIFLSKFTLYLLPFILSNYNLILSSACTLQFHWWLLATATYYHKNTSFPFDPSLGPGRVHYRFYLNPGSFPRMDAGYPCVFSIPSW